MEKFNKRNLEKSMSDLKLLQAMMEFDPFTGETVDIELESEENKSLYHGSSFAVKVLEQEIIRLEGCNLCKKELQLKSSYTSGQMLQLIGNTLYALESDGKTITSLKVSFCPLCGRNLLRGSEPKSMDTSKPSCFVGSNSTSSSCKGASNPQDFALNDCETCSLNEELFKSSEKTVLEDPVKTIFEMLGLRPYEKFEVVDRSPEYYISERLEVVNSYNNNVSKVVTIQNLLLGEDYIVKKPWKPSEGERFFFVTSGLEIGTVDCYLSGITLQILLVKLGNCYRSRDEVTKEEIEKWKNFYKSDERIF